jgi:hypothetical protein
MERYLDRIMNLTIGKPNLEVFAATLESLAETDKNIMK